MQETITKVTCDICKEPIESDQKHVFAGVYGLDFHELCLQKVNGTIIGLLVDDVTVGLSETYIDKPGHANRLYWDKKFNQGETS